MRRTDTATNNCELCGAVYTTKKPWLAKYCQPCKRIATNLSHQRAARRKRPPGTPRKPPPTLTKACVDCGGAFETTYLPTARCAACRLKRHGQTGLHGSLAPRPCIHCGKTIEEPFSKAQRLHPDCKWERKNEAQRVRAYNRRVTDRRRGSEMVCAHCGLTTIRNSGWQRYCVSCAMASSARARQYLVALGLKPWAGHHDREFEDARIYVLDRDAYRCRQCGKRDCRLEVHHIDGRGMGLRKAFRNHAVENLITLCCACHRRVQCHPELLQPQRVEIRATGTGQEIVEVG